eukprot:365259-Chlamydomonas_euryale.AAC.1
MHTCAGLRSPEGIGQPKGQGSLREGRDRRGRGEGQGSLREGRGRGGRGAGKCEGGKGQGREKEDQ